MQYQTGQGPCLDAIFEDVTYLIDDLTGDERWPPFSRRAARQTGVRRMLCPPHPNIRPQRKAVDLRGGRPRRPSTHQRDRPHSGAYPTETDNHTPRATRDLSG